MKIAIMSILFSILAVPVYGQVIEPRWKVMNEPILYLAPFETFKPMPQFALSYVPVRDGVWSILVKDDPMKPGFGMGTCQTTLSLIETLTAPRTITIQTILDAGICGHYTIPLEG